MGEYRCVAMVVNHLIFADPGNTQALQLQAAALEQLGYQAEAGPWRNFYLSGAQELRDGVDSSKGSGSTASPDTIRAMDMDSFFDFMGIHLKASEAEGKKAVINWDFTDTGEKYVLSLENSVLDHTPNKQDPNADVSVITTRETLNQLLLGETTILKAIVSGDLKFTGDRLKLVGLFKLMDCFDLWFNIVTP
jgi:alkyl sulfatase BDS1-like metallo-beta-lactamase superfamily hydrolase